jgi:hypothetical protein
MIQLNARLLWKICLPAGLFALSSTMRLSPAAAQTTNIEAAQQSLNKIVHLNLGVTTVGKLMAALSEQTGLKIQAAEYLQARTITVQMDGLTAASALDALKELNDWTSSSSVQNEILISRRRLRVDAVPAAIPRLMQAAIPKDMRTFLQIPNPGEDVANYRNIYGPRGAKQSARFRSVSRKILALVRAQAKANPELIIADNLARSSARRN